MRLRCSLSSSSVVGGDDCVLLILTDGPNCQLQPLTSALPLAMQHHSFDDRAGLLWCKLPASSAAWGRTAPVSSSLCRCPTGSAVCAVFHSYLGKYRQVGFFSVRVSDDALLPAHLRGLGPARCASDDCASCAARVARSAAGGDWCRQGV